MDKTGKIGDWTYRAQTSSFEIGKNEDDFRQRKDDNQHRQGQSFNIQEHQEKINMDVKIPPRYRNMGINENLQENKQIEVVDPDLGQHYTIEYNNAEMDYENVEFSWQEHEELKGSLESHLMTRKMPNILMLAEWAQSIPDNLEEEWVFKMCPQGDRCLLIAQDGITSIYDRDGKYQSQFLSLIPGGSPSPSPEVDQSSNWSMLDVIFSGGAFYILDLLVWRGVDYRNQTTAKRLEIFEQIYWCNQELKIVTLTNAYRFLYLSWFPAERMVLQSFLGGPNIPFSGRLDGMLFYRRSMIYLPGRQSQFLWTKSFMAGDIFKIKINTILLQQAPPDYKGQKSRFRMFC